jgi:hypothetical protein
LEKCVFRVLRLFVRFVCRERGGGAGR